MEQRQGLDPLCQATDICQSFGSYQATPMTLSSPRMSVLQNHITSLQVMVITQARQNSSTHVQRQALDIIILQATNMSQSLSSFQATHITPSSSPMSVLQNHNTSLQMMIITQAHQNWNPRVQRRALDIIILQSTDMIQSISSFQATLMTLSSPRMSVLWNRITSLQVMVIAQARQNWNPRVQRQALDIIILQSADMIQSSTGLQTPGIIPSQADNQSPILSHMQRPVITPSAMPTPTSIPMAIPNILPIGTSMANTSPLLIPIPNLSRPVPSRESSKTCSASF